MVQRDMGLKGNEKQTEVEKQPKEVKRTEDDPGSTGMQSQLPGIWSRKTASSNAAIVNS